MPPKLSFLKQPARGKSPNSSVKCSSNSARIPIAKACAAPPNASRRPCAILTSGYRQDPAKILNGAMFSVCYDEMVVVKDIEVYSLCEHHLLPFFGKCHVAYIPDKKVVGLSQDPAPGESCFRAACKFRSASPARSPRPCRSSSARWAWAWSIEARHLCMVMRGVEKQNSDGHDQRHAGRFPR